MALNRRVMCCLPKIRASHHRRQNMQQHTDRPARKPKPLALDRTIHDLGVDAFRRMVRFLVKHPVVAPVEKPGRVVRACGMRKARVAA